MIRLLIRGPREETARAVAEELAGQLQRSATAQEDGFRLVGPAAAAIPKLRGNFRFQIQLHAAQMSPLCQLVEQTMAQHKPPKEVVTTIDVDPWDML